MRLYSFNKLMLIQRMLRHLSFSIGFRLGFIALMLSGSALLGVSAHADDETLSEAQKMESSLGRFLDTKAQLKSDIEVVNRPLIAGLWGMKIPNANCTEYYNFKENGEFFVKSSGEKSLGKYVYQLPEMGAMATTLPQLTLGILYDNGDTDCSGNKINQTGEVHQEYVKWLSASRIQFCSTVDGRICQLELQKVLP
jgi:hypothetical protein